MTDIPLRDGRLCPWAIDAYPPRGAPPARQYLPVLEAARNYADKAWPVCAATITHLETGEEWKRRGGEWRQTRLAAQPELALDEDQAS